MRWLAFPRIALSLTLATLAALVLIGINEAGFRESSRALEDIGEAQRARLALNELLQDVVNAETGQRGYLLTGEVRWDWEHRIVPGDDLRFSITFRTLSAKGRRT